MTDMWRQKAAEPEFEAHVATALETLTVIEAANAEEESLAIAVALREAVHDGKTAALVTPDRALGRRVLAALARWNIVAEDSGGDALAETPAGIFARLAAETALHGFAPVTLLALLKHPLLRLDMNGTEDAVATLERAILRGPRPRAGTRGLAHALKTFGETKDSLHPSEPRRALTDAELAAAADLVTRLGEALKPFESLGRDEASTRRSGRTPSRRAGRAIAARQRTKSRSPAATAQSSAMRSTNWRRARPRPACRSSRPTISNCFPQRLPAASCVVPRQPGMRVRILGPLEARLTESDRVVLGGLVEGTWPPESQTDAWLSRPMRLKLGLDLPERRIGLSAHDFAQLLGAREVILTHAAKIAGTPTVPSRFIQRLAAVAGERWKHARDRGDNYLDLGARARPARDDYAGAAAGAETAARGTADRPFGDRDRALAARSLYDLRQAHPAARPARSDRAPNPAPPSAARSFTPPSANSRNASPKNCRTIRRASSSNWDGRISPR